MAQEVKLIQTGANKSECRIAQWLVADGQQVKEGDVIFTMETDKVSVDVEANADGTLQHLIAVGEERMSGDIAAYIYQQGEEIREPVESATQSSANNLVSDEQVETARQVSSGEPSARIKASPKARKLAERHAIDLHTVTGSGGNQRIIARDVERALEQSQHSKPVFASPLAKRIAKQQQVTLDDVTGSGVNGKIMKDDVIKHRQPSATDSPEYISKPHTGMRKVIASRMQDSLLNSAQLTMNREVLMAETIKLRQSLNQEWQAEGIKISYNDILVKTLAKALAAHPLMNSSYTDTEIRMWQQVNIGIAVAVDEGLLVPVIKGAEQLTLKEIAVESQRLIQAARNQNLTPQDLQGGTFTISTLGMYDIDSFTPIVNQPQCGILGVNRIYDGVEWQGDKPVKTAKMNLSLSWDHRILDGAPAASFLVTVNELLTQPYRLLV
ncbi:dihydrolipoamide acetyltransferase family protein [Thalassotalea mangrovi]|uniref:Dihydrolipoamide acetyltransferase component of pyruvate dehydrogenase complex n=1 Tax=Thalassotalea mangrovi TaxID=2572245 RepID=A0A4U1B4K5_9GAMM|nr:dihydrolipoamide acetyltransferase family protein [Thalassotalea mangrovi]TKB45310.1 2-oxo acid dehydrogenase subunit E2 [Thalassotalea mangrovi]